MNRNIKPIEVFVECEEGSVKAMTYKKGDTVVLQGDEIINELLEGYEWVRREDGAIIILEKKEVIDEDEED